MGRPNWRIQSVKMMKTRNDRMTFFARPGKTFNQIDLNSVTLCGICYISILTDLIEGSGVGQTIANATVLSRLTL